MPLRNDSSLAWNMSGCVAYYQPVMAPNPLLARYNQAQGGSARHKLTPVSTTPTYSPILGWGGGYWATGIVPENSNWSMVLRYVVSGSSTFAGTYDVAKIFNAQRFGTTLYFGNGTYTNSGVVDNAGTVAIAGRIGYIDGVAWGPIGADWSGGTHDIYVGGINSGGTPTSPTAGYIAAIVICRRILSPAEVWHASRQMQYCDVNPDWSAWGRRRQWFYGPQVAAGAVGVYGRRGAVALPGGVRIEAGNG